MTTKSIHALTVLIFAFAQPLLARDAPTLTVIWPPEGAEIPLGADPEGAVGAVVSNNFRLISAGACGADPRWCGPPASGHEKTRRIAAAGFKVQARWGLSVILALAGLEATVRLVDHISAATTTDHAVVTVAALERLEAVANLHV